MNVRIINRTLNFVIVLRNRRTSKEQSDSENEHTSSFHTGLLKFCVFPSTSFGGGAEDPERFGVNGRLSSRALSFQIALGCTELRNFRTVKTTGALKILSRN